MANSPHSLDETLEHPDGCLGYLHAGLDELATELEHMSPGQGLTSEQVLEMARRLRALGYDTGSPFDPLS